MIKRLARKLMVNDALTILFDIIVLINFGDYEEFIMKWMVPKKMISFSLNFKAD